MLEPKDARLVFKLMQSFDIFVLNTTEFTQAIKESGMPREVNAIRKKVQDVWLANRSLIDQFIAHEGPALSEEKKEILLEWKRAINDDFVCITYCDDYTVMVQYGSFSPMYAVLGLTEDFKSIIPMVPPFLIKTTLLPFKGKIIWNGLCESYRIVFGPNMSQEFSDEYRQASEQNLITTSL